MTNSLKALLALFLLSLLAMAVTNYPVYSNLTYFWLLLLAGSWLWSRVVLWKVKFQRRTFTRRAQVGEIFEERFEFDNPTRIPKLWIEIDDQSTLPGSRGSQVHSLIGGNQGRSHLSRTRLVERGVFQLGPTSLRSGDPFGFFPVSVEFPDVSSLMALPMTVDVQNFPGPPGHLPGGDALRRRTHQITPNAASVREYVTGDPMSRIHWPSSAKRGKLIVKEFELDPLAEVWVFMDAEKDVHTFLPYVPQTDVEDDIFRKEAVVEIAPSTLEYGCIASASIARYFLRLGRAVGLVVGGMNVDILSPDKGGRQLSKMMEMLTLLNADGEMPFSALLSTQARHIPRGSTVVMVTPTTRPDFNLSVDQLLRLGLRPVVVMMDSSSFMGASGSAELAGSIEMLGVPVKFIRKGDSIGDMLSIHSMEIPLHVVRGEEARNII